MTTVQIFANTSKKQKKMYYDQIMHVHDLSGNLGGP